jgi:plastocyanin
MQPKIRVLLSSTVLALVALAGLGFWSHGRAIAANTTVIMYDNSAPFRPAGDPGLGLWQFTPAHIAVTVGDQVTFVNPSSGRTAHTVTSITPQGTPTDRSLQVGAQFDSSPSGTTDAVQPGSSWVLDTSTLQPGQYVYFCKIHPWQIGTITVSAAS